MTELQDDQDAPLVNLVMLFVSLLALPVVLLPFPRTHHPGML
jgi:hypothetical protein